jgi:hypothetical protein
MIFEQLDLQVGLVRLHSFRHKFIVSKNND